jgi:hypothetical protein
MRSHAQVDDTGVSKAQLKHKLTEVAIIGDQNAALLVSNLQDRGIWQIGGVIAANSCGVMPARSEMRRNPGITTGVDEKLQC